MSLRFLEVILLAISVPQIAFADIYTWVDAGGTINVSNLAPPESIHPTHVVHSSPPPVAPRDPPQKIAAQAEVQTDVQVLRSRVRQLEAEAELSDARPAPIDYRPAPPPMIVQYVINAAPPPVPYAPTIAPALTASAPGYCDPSQIECGLWGTTGFYPPSVVVVPALFSRAFHAGRPHTASGWQPIHSGGMVRHR